MKNLILAVIILGGIGYGIYHYTRPKPAFDVERLEKLTDALGEKAEMLGKMVDATELPDWAMNLDEYLKGLGDVLDLHTGDCAETVKALEKHQADFRGRLLQGDLGDQAVFMQKIKEMPRDKQQELAAKLVVMLHGRYQDLLPRIKDFSNDCLEESAVFYKVLR